MKKLSITIIDHNGEVKRISAYVEDETATALEYCDKEIRRVYILDKHEEQNLDHRESRRQSSLEQITEEGQQFGTDEYDPATEYLRYEQNKKLHAALRTLTDKQYHALWRYAVDGLTFQQIAVEMGIRWDTVRWHYRAAIKKLQKVLRNTP